MTETRDPSLAHVDAIHGLLDLALDYTVYLGEVTDTDADLTYPYLIVWPPPGNRTPVNLTGTVSALSTTTQITAVGQSPHECLAALDRAAAALQGVRPALTGRSAGQILQLDLGAGVIAQSDVTRTPAGRPVWRGVAQYRLTSTPAPAAA